MNTISFANFKQIYIAKYPTNIQYFFLLVLQLHINNMKFIVTCKKLLNITFLNYSSLIFSTKSNILKQWLFFLHCQIRDKGLTRTKTQSFDIWKHFALITHYYLSLGCIKTSSLLFLSTWCSAKLCFKKKNPFKCLVMFANQIVFSPLLIYC